MVKELGKIPRNFGRRGPLGQGPRGGSGGWHKPVRSDCLLKTQVRAKSQDDVYGLTPARCWKVKRTC